MSDGAIVPVMRYRNPAAAAQWLCEAYGFSIHHVAKAHDGGIAYVIVQFADDFVVIGPPDGSVFDDLMVQPIDVGNRSTQTCYLTKIERVRALMEQHIPEATDEDCDALVDQLTLPDDGDRHVLAAAIKGDADILVTVNLKHFPAPAVAPYGIEALHPDEFVLRLIERVPARVLAAARDHRQSLKNPPKSVEEYLAALEKLGLAGTVAALRPFAALLE